MRGAETIKDFPDSFSEMLGIDPGLKTDGKWMGDEKTAESAEYVLLL